MQFNYRKLYNAVLDTFKFGDTRKAKCEELGITTHEFTRIRQGQPISLESVLSCLIYLKSIKKDDMAIELWFKLFLDGDTQTAEV